MKFALALLIALVGVGTLATVTANADENELDRTKRELAEAQDTIRYLAGRNIILSARMKKAQRQRTRYRRGLLAKRRELRRRWEPTIPHLIAIAAAAYGQSSSTLERKARCESVNFTAFYNSGSGASGLFQFLPSTWRSTPFAGFNIFDHAAQALAASWMHSRGRGGEWVCR